MGMYTELNIGVALKSDTPPDVINILQYMLRDTDLIIPEFIPKHPLFKTERWGLMLVCDSYYFDGHTDSSMVYDKISHEYSLNVRSNFKNYSNEIDLFLDFIRPYLSTEGYLGYYRYEEWETPSLIFYDKYKTKNIVIWHVTDDGFVNKETVHKN